MQTQSTAPAQPVSAPTARSKLWHSIVIRLADEGVPVRAIVRSLLQDYTEVREVLVNAADRGLITTIPRDDWPPGTRRDERQPDTVPLEYEDTHMTMLAMRTFDLTPAEAKMFVVLLRRREATKNTLHSAVQRDDVTGNEEPSEIKIVDVFICKLRKKLKRAKVDTQIETIWGKGYCIPVIYKPGVYKRMGVRHDEFNPTGVKEEANVNDPG